MNESINEKLGENISENPDENVLEVDDLYVHYDTDGEIVYAVNGISFSIKRGEALGLVGETGAGKTTTALAILHLLPKYTGKIPSGSIKLRGVDMVNASNDQLRKMRGKVVSMIFQDPMTSLDPVMTIGRQIREVVELHTENITRLQAEKRVDEILEMVGIKAERKFDYPHQFSGGMRQRVMIAIAIACNPNLLIADEPTTALDVTIQAQILKMMRKLRKELMSAVLLITHDLGVVANFCDKVAIMYAGEIIEYGTLEDIFDVDKLHHPYTNGLFGSIPNLKVDTDRLHPIAGLMPDPTELPSGCKFHPRCPLAQKCCESGEVPVQEENGHKVMCHFAERRRINE